MNSHKKKLNPNRSTGCTSSAFNSAGTTSTTFNNALNSKML